MPFSLNHEPLFLEASVGAGECRGLGLGFKFENAGPPAESVSVFACAQGQPLAALRPPSRPSSRKARHPVQHPGPRPPTQALDREPSEAELTEPRTQPRNLRQAHESPISRLSPFSGTPLSLQQARPLYSLVKRPPRPSPVSPIPRAGLGRSEDGGGIGVGSTRPAGPLLPLRSVGLQPAAVTTGWHLPTREMVDPRRVDVVGVSPDAHRRARVQGHHRQGPRDQRRAGWRDAGRRRSCRALLGRADTGRSVGPGARGARGFRSRTLLPALLSLSLGPSRPSCVHRLASTGCPEGAPSGP